MSDLASLCPCAKPSIQTTAGQWHAQSHLVPVECQQKQTGAGAPVLAHFQLKHSIPRPKFGAPSCPVGWAKQNRVTLHIHMLIQGSSGSTPGAAAAPGRAASPLAASMRKHRRGCEGYDNSAGHAQEGQRAGAWQSRGGKDGVPCMIIPNFQLPRLAFTLSLSFYR